MRALTHRITLICLGLLCSVAMWWSSAQTPAEADAGKKSVANDIEGSKKLWGALVYAVKDAASKRDGYEDADAEMAKSLQQVFKDYKHFQVLGTRAEALFKTTHSWVAPSKQLCVKFDFVGLTEDGIGVKLNLQLWNQGKAIVKTDAILKPGSPVFMEGPEWGNGRLLYVLRLQDGKNDREPLD